MAWSPQGDLIATGSNDKTVKLMRYNDDQKQLEGREVREFNEFKACLTDDLQTFAILLTKCSFNLLVRFIPD